MEKNKGGRPKKFDYSGDEFYNEVYRLAMQGATDEEIAAALGETTGTALGYAAFRRMASGTYNGWTEEENKKWGLRLRRTLESARFGLNRIVRGRFLKCALGGVEVKSTTVIRRKLKIDGVYTDDEEIQTTTNISETAPNVGALEHWLYHYDPEWRKVQRGTEEDNGEVKKVTKGISIEEWIKKETSSESEDL